MSFQLVEWARKGMEPQQLILRRHQPVQATLLEVGSDSVIHADVINCSLTAGTSYDLTLQRRLYSEVSPGFRLSFHGALSEN